MHIVKALLIFRPVNLIILAATQTSVYYFLATHRLAGDLANPVFLKLVFCSILLAMAANLNNDVMDVQADHYNKPGRNYSAYWPSVKVLHTLYLVLTALSVYLAFTIAPGIGWTFISLHVLLFLYNRSFKRWAVIGNLVIAWVTAYSLVIVALVFHDVDTGLLFFYSGFAFLTTLIREIIKDAEDADGDQMAGYKTLPLLIGERRINRVIANVTVFTLVLLTTLGYKNIGAWFSGPHRLLVIAYGITCVLLPLLYVVSRTFRPGEVNYRELSAVLKYVMVTGMASMLFF